MQKHIGWYNENAKIFYNEASQEVIKAYKLEPVFHEVDEDIRPLRNRRRRLPKKSR